MKYALVIVQDPQSQGVDTQTLRNFANSLLGEGRRIPQAAMLNVGAWLLPLQNGLQSLAGIVAEARDRKLRLRTLFLDQEPTWIETNP